MPEIQPLVIPPIDNLANDTIAQATNLGLLRTSVSRQGSVEQDNVRDFYRFSTAESSSLTVTLTNLQADVDLIVFQDLNGDQILNSLDWYKSGTLGGISDEKLTFQDLKAGTYFIEVYGYNPYGFDRSKAPSSNYQLSIQLPDIQPKTPQLQFNEFKLEDASGDSSITTIMQQGSLHLSYSLTGISSVLQSVSLEATIAGSTIPITLGTWNDLSQRDALIDLSRNISPNTPSFLPSGNYSTHAIATFTNGDRIISNTELFQIVDWKKITGTLAADVFNYDRTTPNNVVIFGLGGTDTLNLVNIQSSDLLSLNGIALSSYRPDRITNQAIFGGTSFDFLNFSDGREIYFQGIERLNFADGSILLTPTPNDSGYSEQWNLRATDVEGAWRFNSTQTSQVLLVSLDTGIVTTNELITDSQDLDRTRLIFDPTKDDDNYNDSGHGQRAISIMAATPNNNRGIVGINWLSSVYVRDIYGGRLGDASRSNLQDALKESIAYARSRNMKVVFQGGIQGEFWLQDGGTQADLEAILSGSETDAFYAIAAGNGGIDLDKPNLTATERETSGGVARLQASHGNVASVGAATLENRTLLNGQINVTSVARASYSNYGKNLTLMAPTTVPVINRDGVQEYFAGTSAANPNLAAIASLVWGANLNLTGAQVRDILTETAMDVGVVGRDDYYGAGFVNAEAAVRRAYALGRDRALAQTWKIFATA
jgi:serine protease